MNLTNISPEWALVAGLLLLAASAVLVFIIFLWVSVRIKLRAERALSKEINRADWGKW